MVEALKNEGMKYLLKRLNIEPDTALIKNLDDFVSNNTLRFFNILGILPQFLNKDVEIL